MHLQQGILRHTNKTHNNSITVGKHYEKKRKEREMNLLTITKWLNYNDFAERMNVDNTISKAILHSF